MKPYICQLLVVCCAIATQVSDIPDKEGARVTTVQNFAIPSDNLACQVLPF